MKKKLMILLVQLCIIVGLMKLPVLMQVNGNKIDMLQMFSLGDVSKLKAIILLVLLLTGLFIEKTKLHKLGCMIHGITIVYLVLLAYIVQMYGEVYATGDITMICNYGVFVLLFAYLIANMWICIKEIRNSSGKNIETMIFSPKALKICAIGVSVVVFACGLISYDKVISAKDKGIVEESEKHCSMENVLVKVKNLDEQQNVYKKNNHTI